MTFICQVYTLSSFLSLPLADWLLKCFFPVKGAAKTLYEPEWWKLLFWLLCVALVWGQEFISNVIESGVFTKAKWPERRTLSGSWMRGQTFYPSRIPLELVGNDMWMVLFYTCVLLPPARPPKLLHLASMLLNEETWGLGGVYPHLLAASHLTAPSGDATKFNFTFTGSLMTPTTLRSKYKLKRFNLSQALSHIIPDPVTYSGVFFFIHPYQQCRSIGLATLLLCM